ncbi:MAG: filamentous hemagglutinin N-terminal domain-containing protein [Rivularia sp. (in: cyanobacteria)]
MKGIAFLPGLISALLTSGIVLPAIAQVTSDNTTNTTVNSTGNDFNILNGIQKGNNLFHSFKEFSIPTGGSANFNNSTNVVNIINRVTGGNISDIDGLIKTSGNANLFLINTAGIVFGENASLDIGGSFFVSTAESILFEDGFEFTAVNPQSTPLLSVSVPLGLQMGSNSGNIQINGNGHQSIGGLFSPRIRNNTQSTLQVNSGNSIALVGKNITFNGGVLTAENGRIELGAVKTGTVNLNSSSSNLQLSYDNIENFGDIQLINKSSLDGSGLTSNGIQLQGQNITLKDGSSILIQNTGNETPSDIQVSAKGILELSGDVRIAPDIGNITGVTSSSFITETLGTARGADINISVGNLHLNDGGVFATKTFSAASGGNITVNVVEDIQVNGTAALNPISPSGITASNFSSGESGNIYISASNLALTQGATINATNFGQGDSGNLDINVSGTIKLVDADPQTLSPTNIGSTVFREGNGGSLNLNTSKLIVEDGAAVNTSSLNSGNGGKITINASESIEVKGISPNSPIASAIGASVPVFPVAFRQNFGLPDKPSGNAGDITINTPKFQISNGGIVAVNNEGVNDGGNLIVNTDSLRLDNKGIVLADTVSGEGGNIFLNIKSDLIIQNGSIINARSSGTGNGGNITIDSPIIAGFENSDIIASAVEGNGGNINIKTQGLFGLQFREQLTNESDINASSQFGISGQVVLQQLDFNPVNNLIQLPSNFENTTKLKAGCRASVGQKFIVSGRGGLPEKPSNLFNGSQVLIQLLDLTPEEKIPFLTSFQNNNANYDNQQKSIIEATGFSRNENGEIELVASSDTDLKINHINNCSGARLNRSILY